MNLFVYVEGQEEEMFVNRVLRGYLRSFGVTVQKPILAATSFRIGEHGEPEVTVGGVTNYTAIYNDILDQFAGTQIEAKDLLTTFIDLYALPSSFPGYSQALAQGLAGGKMAEFIEHEWQLSMGFSNFKPYIQSHEFETLILTKPSTLETFYPEYRKGIKELGDECGSYSTPEDINGSKETSPSHRILARIPTYTKIDGFRHIQEIGIPELKTHNPRFKKWIELLENSPSPESI